MDRPLALRILAGLLAVAAAGALVAGQEPQFRGGTDTVPVFATVFDANGRLVTDLTRDDFMVLDNGRPQALTTFTNADQPITVIMMLDRSGSVESLFSLVERAAAAFVEQLGPEDRARIGSFSTKIRIDPPWFTGDHETLLAILRDDLLPFGPTPLWNATDRAMTAVGNETGRRVVLMFTDGKDMPVDEGPDVTFEQVRRRVETEDVMMYAIGLAKECGGKSPLSFLRPSAPASLVAFQRGVGRGGGGQGRIGGGGRGIPGRIGPLGRGPGARIPVLPPPRIPNAPGYPPTRPPMVLGPGRTVEAVDSCSSARPDPHLRVLTAIGGGGYFELNGTADLDTTFARVADELHRQYLLAYVAPEHDGVLHHLEVRVRRPDVTVRARTGYMAPRSFDATRDVNREAVKK